jgi:hypothetical protein
MSRASGSGPRGATRRVPLVEAGEELRLALEGVALGAALEPPFAGPLALRPFFRFLLLSSERATFFFFLPVAVLLPPPAEAAVPAVILSGGGVEDDGLCAFRGTAVAAATRVDVISASPT